MRFDLHYDDGDGPKWSGVLLVLAVLVALVLVLIFR